MEVGIPEFWPLTASFMSFTIPDIFGSGSTVYESISLNVKQNVLVVATNNQGHARPTWAGGVV